MKKIIDNYEITSNMKKTDTINFDDLTKKQQKKVLKEYGHIEEIETSYFVKCCNEILPTEEISNFDINCIPRNIQKYFYKLFPNTYFGVAPFGVYLSNSYIFAISEFQEYYIKFKIF